MDITVPHEKKHAVCLKHLPCFLYYFFLNSFRMSLRIRITCSDSLHCFCNRWGKLREWSNTVTAKPYLLQKPKDQKDTLVFSSVKGKQRVFFFSSVYMRTCWVMFDSLRPYGSSQAPLSIEFSRQEYWSGLPFPSPKDLPNPGVELESPVLVGGFFTTVRSSCFLTSPISLCPGCVWPTHPMRHFPWVFCHWSCVSGW